MDQKNEDCYYFYYSTCTKGDDCPFRHCAEALGQKEICKYWEKRRDCCRKKCPYRHFDTKRDRGSIPCFFEEKESGCMKPHCAYLHSKPRLHLQKALERKDPSVIMPLKDTVSKKSQDKQLISNPGSLTSGNGSSRTSDYDASSESTDDETQAMVKQLAREIQALYVQKGNKKSNGNHVAPGYGSLSQEVNFPMRQRKKKIEVEARSASCHGTRIRTPFAAARPNNNLHREDVIWQFDSSKLPTVPKSSEHGDLHHQLAQGLSTKQKGKHGCRRKKAT